MITLSFVIPVYNEEKRLEKTFKALQNVRIPRGVKLEKIIFVNDGSTDNSECRMQNSELQKKYSIRLLSYHPNRGKGYAVKQGMLASSSDYTLFFDADMSTPLSELAKFVPYMQKGIDCIIGTRKNGESTVLKHQPKYREVLGNAFTKLTQIILLTHVSDFTCGFKAFKKVAKEEIFPRSMISGWGYDAEIIFLANKYQFSLAEQSVLWANDLRTRVKLSQAIPQTLLELVKIRFFHTVLPLLAVILNLFQDLPGLPNKEKPLENA